MPLIAEDGTGRADAESYLTVAAADLYLASRGFTIWAPLLDAEKEQALRRATDYMVQVYRLRWAGHRTNTGQALDWPRAWVPIPDDPLGNYYADGAIPAAVANACAELALRAAAGPLIPDETQAVKREKVGTIEVEYQDFSRATKTYRAIDNLLAPLLGAGGGLRILRA